MLGRANDDLRDRHPARGAQGLPQQRIDFLAGLRRYEVIRRLVELRWNFSGGNESLDVDRLRCLDIGAPEVLVGKHYVLILLVLVALDDVAPFDFLAGLLAVALIADGREVALVEHREFELAPFLGGIKLDRNVHKAEGDGAFPDRAGHGSDLRTRRCCQRDTFDADTERYGNAHQSAAIGTRLERRLGGQLAARSAAARHVAPMTVVRTHDEHGEPSQKTA